MEDSAAIKSAIANSGVLNDIRHIIEQGLRSAYQSVSSTMVHTYWQIGQRIVEEEQYGKKRAEYGSRLLDVLAEELTHEYATGFSARNLRSYRQLYLNFSDLEIWYTRVPNLEWSHYRALLRVADEDARYWYLREAAREMWSVRTLDRNIGSQYYYRLLQAPQKEVVVKEMLQLTEIGQPDTLEFMKNPLVAEFLQLPANTVAGEKAVKVLRNGQLFIEKDGKTYNVLGTVVK